MKQNTRLFLLTALICALISPAPAADESVWKVTPKGDFQNGSSQFSFGSRGLPKDLLHCGRALIVEGTARLSIPGGRVAPPPLPPAVGKQTTKDGVVFTEAFRSEGREYQYRLEARAMGEGIRVDVKIEGDEAKFMDFVLRLSDKEFIGKTFSADGVKGVFPKAVGKSLVEKGSIREFVAAEDETHNLKVRPLDGCQFELRDGRQWTSGFAISISPNKDKVASFILTPPTSSDWDLFDDFKARGNLIENGGFEIGDHGWGVSLNGLDNASSYRFDASGAFEGDRCLSVRLERTDDGLMTGNPIARISTEFIQGPVQAPVTFSVALRASKPDTKVALRVLYYPNERVGNRGSLMLMKPVTVGTEWKRYSLKATLPGALRDAYSMSIQSVSYDAQPRTLYVDAASLVFGDGKGYRPASPVEVGVDIDAENQMIAPGERISLPVVVRSTAKETKKLSVRTRVLGPGYFVATDLSEPVTCKPNESMSVGGASLMPELRGSYRVYVEVTDKTGKVVASARDSFGVVDDRPVSKPNPDGRFGAHIGNDSMRQTLGFLSRLGFTWTRGGPVSDKWPYLEPKQGEYNEGAFERSRELRELFMSYGQIPLPNPTRTPDWAANAPKGTSTPHLYAPREDALDDYARFVEKYVSLHKGVYPSYEIWNEPNIPMFYRGTPKEFVGILRTASQTIRRTDPEASVVGYGLTHLSPGCRTFLESTLKLGALEYCDAISWHPYRPGRLGPEETHVREELQEIRDVIGKYGEAPPLWATEFGWFAPHKFSKSYTPCKNAWIAKRYISEEECARYYTQMVATSFAFGVEKMFYFIFQEGDIANRWFHGFVAPHGRYPKSVYMAAAAVRHMDGADDFKQTVVFDDLWLTRVITGDDETCLLWKGAGAVEVEIATDGALEFEDLYGNPFTLKPKNGIVLLTIGEDAVYVKRAAAKMVISRSETQILTRRVKAKPGEYPTRTIRGMNQVIIKSAMEPAPGQALRLPEPEITEGSGCCRIPDGAIVGEICQQKFWIEDWSRLFYEVEVVEP